MAMSTGEFAELFCDGKSFRFDYNDGTSDDLYNPKREAEIVMITHHDGLVTNYAEFNDGYLVRGEQHGEDWLYVYDENNRIVESESWDKQGGEDD